MNRESRASEQGRLYTEQLSQDSLEERINRESQASEQGRLYTEQLSQDR